MAMMGILLMALGGGLVVGAVVGWGLAWAAIEGELQRGLVTLDGCRYWVQAAELPAAEPASVRSESAREGSDHDDAERGSRGV